MRAALSGPGGRGEFHAAAAVASRRCNRGPATEPAAFTSRSSARATGALRGRAPRSTALALPLFSPNVSGARCPVPTGGGPAPVAIDGRKEQAASTVGLLGCCGAAAPGIQAESSIESSGDDRWQPEAEGKKTRTCGLSNGPSRDQCVIVQGSGTLQTAGAGVLPVGPGSKSVGVASCRRACTNHEKWAHEKWCQEGVRTTVSRGGGRDDCLHGALAGRMVAVASPRTAESPRPRAASCDQQTGGSTGSPRPRGEV